MGSEVVRLTGDAAMGLFPAGGDRQLRRSLLTLPQAVRLGRIPAPCPPGVPRLADFLAADSEWQPPAASDWSAKAVASIARMYANDRLGCCVISARAHNLGVWTANDSDSPGEVMPTDAEVVSEYRRICGPGDNGCVITRVLDEGVRNGFRFAGGTRRLGGYVAVHTTRPQLIRAALHLFGALTVGFYFRSAWQSQSTWAPSSSPIVGGHDVGVVGYDEQGLIVMSWGRLYRMTWELVATSDVDEMYAILSPDWTGSDKLAPSGVNVDALVTALGKIGGGVMPDGPTPPPPPKPPQPTTFHGVGKLVASEPGGPLDRVIFDGQLGNDLDDDDDGKPEVKQTDFDCRTRAAAVVVSGALFPLPGIQVFRTDSVVTVVPKGISPEGWAAIIQIIKIVLEALGPIING